MIPISPYHQPSPGSDVNFVYHNRKKSWPKRYKVVAFIVVLLIIANIGAYALRLYYYNEIVGLVNTLPSYTPHPSPTPSMIDATGQHCGGFIKNAPTCPTGYTCKLNMSVADVGGMCVKNNIVCIQVITRAKNPQTGETRDFPTPCDVPEGWEKI